GFGSGIGSRVPHCRHGTVPPLGTPASGVVVAPHSGQTTTAGMRRTLSGRGGCEVMRPCYGRPPGGSRRPGPGGPAVRRDLWDPWDLWGPGNGRGRPLGRPRGGFWLVAQSSFFGRPPPNGTVNGSPVSSFHFFFWSSVSTPAAFSVASLLS